MAEMDAVIDSHHLVISNCSHKHLKLSAFQQESAVSLKLSVYHYDLDHDLLVEKVTVTRAIDNISIKKEK